MKTDNKPWNDNRTLNLMFLGGWIIGAFSMLRFSEMFFSHSTLRWQTCHNKMYFEATCTLMQTIPCYCFVRESTCIKPVTIVIVQFHLEIWVNSTVLHFLLSVNVGGQYRCEHCSRVQHYRIIHVIVAVSSQFTIFTFIFLSDKL